MDISYLRNVQIQFKKGFRFNCLFKTVFLLQRPLGKAGKLVLRTVLDYFVVKLARMSA